jgi:hypothetical protein
MKAEMKYVVVDSEKKGQQLFVFPTGIEYDDFVKVLNYIRYGDGRTWFCTKYSLVNSGVIDNSNVAQVIETEMKYIVMNSAEAGKQLFIFPKSVDHDRMADVLSEVEQLIEGVFDNFYRTPVSAGFTDGKDCYGKSESLNLKSNPKDTELLKYGGSKK